ncbi:MAG TPA: RNA-binding cell elongation regulator Jag/EloR [Thermomicrobiaceae bacterium]|nr:RNA-binding cell elongation regulator Jag/EloR [Thermomicrobiaceae bacterium]
MSTRPMNSVEIAARTVDEAVRLALEQLGCSREQVEVEILSDTSDQEDGEALVRVIARGAAPAPAARPVARGPHPQTAPRRPQPTQHPSRPRADQETEQTVKQVVSELLQKMGYQQVEVRAVDNPSAIEVGPDEPPTVFIDIEGRDLGTLIGRRGEHLTQLQYMLNVLVNKHLTIWTRVIVDVEGYRTRREESIVGLAQRVAKQVARNRRPISLEPMPPNERRVVHVALRDEPNVTTLSSGEGALRRVTIYPK